ncbi:hypothetical protein SHKM778_22700 [Streptomyces sp. KM77-8]|uniref:Uncharacterized protein n=1 Tax=Streptomyces haneummycinicus TaxID=3074435 RepID=A0AAT9HET1_9ACTN
MQQRLVVPGKLGAQGGHGVTFHRGAAGEADVLQFAHGRARAVAADQVTAAPPGAGGAPGVGGDARRLLLHAVQPAVHGDPDEPFTGQRRAQRTRQHVLGDVQGSGIGVAEDGLGRHLLAPHRPPSGPADPGVRERHSGQPLHQRGGLLAQHDGARRAGFVLARPFVEDHARHLLACQRQGERESDGPRSDDDHRVHGASPLLEVTPEGTWRNRKREQGARSQNVCNLLPVLASSDRRPLVIMKCADAASRT